MKLLTTAALLGTVCAATFPALAQDNQTAPPAMNETAPAAAPAPEPTPAPTAAMAPQAPEPAPMQKVSDKHVEARIKQLHDELKITPAEGDKWSKVADVMRANAAEARSAMEERTKNQSTMTAVDDIHSYQKMTQGHADGLGRFADAFESLYSSMPEAQQKLADKVFGHIHPKPKTR